MPASSVIDSALLAVLTHDAALMALVPGGIWFDAAPPNTHAFGLVSLFAEADTVMFGGRAVESGLYLVKAVVLSTEPNAGATVRQAADRIDDLLEGADFPAPPYGHMATFREERVRFIEVDDVDPAIRWLHRGGHYRVAMSPPPS